MKSSIRCLSHIIGINSPKQRSFAKMAHNTLATDLDAFIKWFDTTQTILADCDGGELCSSIAGFGVWVENPPLWSDKIVLFKTFLDTHASLCSQSYGELPKGYPVWRML
jgi:hypothetical protein